MAPAPDARKAKGDAAGGSTSRGGGRTRGGNGGASMPKGDAELAAEQSAAIKKQYLEATEPKNMPTLRLLFSLMAPDTHLLALAYVSLILAAAGESLVPLLYGLVIDAIAINPQPEQFRKYMLYLILTAFLTGIFTGLRGSTFTVIGGVFGKRLRVYLFRALLEQELDFFGATKTGDITSRLSADCQKVADQVQLNVNVFLRSVIQAVFTLALMLFLSPKLALASFVIVPAIVGISKVFGDYMRDLSTETQDALAALKCTMPIAHDQAQAEPEQDAKKPQKNGQSAQAFGVHFIPTPIIIDRNGVVRAAGVKLDKTKELIEKFLAEAAH
jgi:ATP-binding cassette subfamily B (MDR/TAP) protein 9